MLEFFNTLRESGRLTDVRSALRQNMWNLRHLTVRADLLERWLLKTLINLNFVQNLKFGDTHEPPGVPPKELVQIAFGNSAFQGTSGMYVAARPGEYISGLEGVSITTFTEGDCLIASEFKICGIRFVLSLVQEEVHEFQGSKLLHKGVNLVYQVPGPKSRMVRSHVLHIQ